MTFNIGRQSGGIVNNVAGDQHVEGGQRGVEVSRDDASGAATLLRELLATTDLSGLTAEEQASVHEEAAAIDAEMATPEPSAEKVRTRLERITSALSAAGALVGAGAALVSPLTALAQWLGPLGASVLRMLPIG